MQSVLCSQGTELTSGLRRQIRDGLQRLEARIGAPAAVARIRLGRRGTQRTVDIVVPLADAALHGSGTGGDARAAARCALAALEADVRGRAAFPAAGAVRPAAPGRQPQPARGLRGRGSRIPRG